MDCVRPGVELVLANPLTPSRLLIKLDLPTFERPVKTISGRLSFGNDSGDRAAAINFALLIFNALIATEAQSHRERKGRGDRMGRASLFLSFPSSLFSLSLRLSFSSSQRLRCLRWQTVLISSSQRAFGGPGHRRRLLPDRRWDLEIRVGARRRQSLKGDLQDLVHGINGADLERLKHVSGNLGQVLFILLRDDD